MSRVLSSCASVAVYGGIRRIEVRGCDLWTFGDGKVVIKDSYWKI